MKLEVGPGYSKRGGGYIFNPHFCSDYDVVFLDIRRPNFRCDRSAWIVADAHNLPFRDCVFEEVFAGQLIEHLEDPLKFLKECKRVLKEGGMVTVTTPNFLSKNAYLDPSHKHVFNFVRLWKMVKSIGLRPHFPSPNIGSLLPRSLRRLFKVILLLLSDNLTVMGEKA